MLYTKAQNSAMFMKLFNYIAGNNSASKFISHVFNPYVTNGLSHPYHYGESIFFFLGVKSMFLFSFQFLMKFIQANRISRDGTPRHSASHLEQ